MPSQEQLVLAAEIAGIFKDGRPEALGIWLQQSKWRPDRDIRHMFEVQAGMDNYQRRSYGLALTDATYTGRSSFGHVQFAMANADAATRFAVFCELFVEQ